MKAAWWPADARARSARRRCSRIVAHLRGLGSPVCLYAPGDAAPDVLVLSERCDPDSLAHALDLRARTGTVLVLDLCDNHFYVEADPDGRLQRQADAVRHAAASVDLVIAVSRALAEIVLDQAPGVRAIEVVADAVEPPDIPSRRASLTEWRAHRHLRALTRWLAGHPEVTHASRLVWFGDDDAPGLDQALAGLRRIRPDLELAARQHGPLSLTVISHSATRFAEATSGWTVPTRHVPWHPATFSQALMAHGTALIPINLDPFTVGMPANRVLTAFVHGLAVVGDSIPSYAEFRDCAVLDDWETGLGAYRLDTAGREADVAQGRAIATGHFGIEAMARRWLDVLSAVGTSSPSRLSPAA